MPPPSSPFRPAALCPNQPGRQGSNFTWLSIVWRKVVSYLDPHSLSGAGTKLSLSPRSLLNGTQCSAVIKVAEYAPQPKAARTVTDDYTSKKRLYQRTFLINARESNDRTNGNPCDLPAGNMHLSREVVILPMQPGCSGRLTRHSYKVGVRRRGT